MGQTILIVDDSESIRELLALTLEGAGYAAIKAVDGTDALTYIDRNDISLVITDLNMPNMDGIELIKVLRKSVFFSKVPIILLTTELQASKKEEAREAGATGWIVKPFMQQKLVDIVNRIFRKV